MELKIFNRELNLIGVIDSFSSLIWNRKYNSVGDFQLNILFTNEINSILKIDNIIYKDNGECGFISSKEIKISEDGTESIEVKGKFILGYLERRIIWGCEEINSNVIDAAYKLINNNCIECIDRRKIPNLFLGEKPTGINLQLIKQVSYNNLLDTLCSIFQTHEVGMKIDFDIINKKLVFNIFKGIDRSINQSAVAPVIFSRSFENVLNQNYVESLNNFKNVALIGGAGEGADRSLTTIGESSGLNRHELFVDARDISSTRTIEAAEGTTQEVIPNEEYALLLQTRGKEKLLDYYEVKTFDSVININSNIIYKVDYDLGDVITFFDKKWGITIDTRITEVSEVYDLNGVSLNISFGNNVPTLIDFIKRKG